MFSGTSEISIFMIPLMRKLCFRGGLPFGPCGVTLQQFFCYQFPVDFPGAFSSHLGSPGGAQVAYSGMGTAPSGALVKHQLGSASGGFTEVEHHLADLHPGAVPLS